MNYRLLAKIGCRLIALFYFIGYLGFTIQAAFSIYRMANETGGSPDFSGLMSYVSMMLLVVFSILLWIFADKISNSLVGETQSGETFQVNDYDKLQGILFCFAGLLILGNAIPILFSSGFQLIFQLIFLGKEFALYHTSEYIDIVVKIISSVIKFLLGIWLLVGNKGIVRMVRKLQTAGVKKTEIE